MATIQEKVLAQAELAATATSVLSPPAGTTLIIKTILICNTNTTTENVDIWLDDDGTTYDDTTKLYSQQAIAAGATLEITLFLAMNNASGNLAMKTDTANEVTVTIFGAEIT